MAHSTVSDFWHTPSLTLGDADTAQTRSGGGSAVATIVAVHPLGHSSIVVLRMDADATELRARVPGMTPPALGSRVSVAIDGNRTFVFPCADPTS